VTTELYDGLAFAGDGSEAELLGVFATSVLHNIVHLVFGIAAFALAATVSGARTYLAAGGGLEWLPADTADHWLHLALGLGMIGAVVAVTRGRTSS
jgi:hypothetical protein